MADIKTKAKTGAKRQVKSKNSVLLYAVATVVILVVGVFGYQAWEDRQLDADAAAYKWTALDASNSLGGRGGGEFKAQITKQEACRLRLSESYERVYVRVYRSANIANSRLGIGVGPDSIPVISTSSTKWGKGGKFMQLDSTASVTSPYTLSVEYVEPTGGGVGSFDLTKVGSCKR